ncbi:hypothetical protein OJ996_19835 [Luteolibacter sp. GHJ8]|uniref:Uncharacterized protein n=1 Tax=Luteolibacter rhizosphaerae TaxID=2989719 RepID=A0ABT3G7M4_9BACT|nr:hypothetical protein [Luteolibacter rhizosphaerae]MCW1915848.1 hypothetical protein [Luteolibacter rhizosphaerae]
MRITLNSRTLVGPQHTLAASFASEWPPACPVEIVWMQSPSARCVLEVEIPPEEPLIFDGIVTPLDGNDAAVFLERDLREALGLPELEGDDPDGSERQPLHP